eukprot:g55886.t1
MISKGLLSLAAKSSRGPGGLTDSGKEELRLASEVSIADLCIFGPVCFCRVVLTEAVGVVCAKGTRSALGNNTHCVERHVACAASMEDVDSAGMEDVDSILIPILNQFGCQFDEKKSIAKFESDDIYHAAATCLKAINPEHEYTLKLPPGKAPRFRLTSNLSNEIKDMGYNREMGYQTFLYPTEQDSRQLLIWLVDKLPKNDKEEDETEALGADAQLAADILSSLREWGKQEWNPLQRVAGGTVKLRVRTSPLCVPSSKAAPACLAYYSSTQPLVSRQPGQADTFPLSLLEHNAKELAQAKEEEADWGNKQSLREREQALTALITTAFRSALDSVPKEGVLSGSFQSEKQHKGAFSRRTDFEQEKSSLAAQVVTAKGAVQSVTEGGELLSDDADDAIREAREKAIAALLCYAIREAREKELAALQEELKQCSNKIQSMNEEMERNVSTTRQLEAELAQLKEETKKLEQAYKLKRDTLALLPNAQDNLKSLAKLGADKSKALLNLNKEWETVRLALVSKYRKKKQLLEERKADVGRKVAQIKRMRVEMKSKAEMVRQRDRTASWTS